MRVCVCVFACVHACLYLCSLSQAGGFVEDKRVNGTLAVARAIGDFSFKTGSIPPEEQQV